MTAVFCGRFQPFHNGHLVIVDAVLKKYNRLVLGVIINTVRGDEQGKVASARIAEMGDGRQEKELNPIPVLDRVHMIEELVHQKGYTDKVDVVPLPRPSVYWEIVAAMIPAPRTWILGNAADEFEKRKERLFQEKGDSTDWYSFPGTINGTAVRELLRRGDPRIVDYVPDSIYRYLLQFGGSIRW